MADNDTLTHLDAHGQARMVDVGEKTASRRVAVAEGRITMTETAFALLQEGRASKGEVLAIARVGAIAAAKKTADWIPLCHSLPLDSVRVEFSPDTAATGIVCRATATATAKTGVEMEALTAVQAALLIIYDMMKVADKTMEIGRIRLLEKRGGKSGDFIRDNQ